MTTNAKNKKTTAKKPEAPITASVRHLLEAINADKLSGLKKAEALAFLMKEHDGLTKSKAARVLKAHKTALAKQNEALVIKAIRDKNTASSILTYKKGFAVFTTTDTNKVTDRDRVVHDKTYSGLAKFQADAAKKTAAKKAKTKNKKA